MQCEPEPRVAIEESGPNLNLILIAVGLGGLGMFALAAVLAQIAVGLMVAFAAVGVGVGLRFAGEGVAFVLRAQGQARAEMLRACEPPTTVYQLPRCPSPRVLIAEHRQE